MKKLFSERRLFMGSKIVGLVVRPLILLILLRTGRTDAATNFALLLTSVASSFVFLNNQNYRAAYGYFFDTDGGTHGLGGRTILTRYLSGTVIHVVLFIPLCIFFLWLWTDNVLVFAGASILIISEKYFDDDQRALVYKRHYYAWIANFFCRIIFPSSVFLICLLVFGITTIGTYVAATVVGLCVYIGLCRRQFFGLMVKVVYQHIIKRPLHTLWGYLRDYKDEFALAQLWAVVGANVILIDRFLISKARPEDFAAYVLVANIANIIATFHSLGYVTFQRPHLLRPQTSAMQQIFALQNWLIPIGLSAVVFLGYVGLGVLGFEVVDLPLPLVGLLLVVYIFHAVSLVPKEIAFWRFRRIVLLGCDLLTITIPILSYLFVSQSVVVIVLATLSGLIVRFVLFVVMIANPSARTHL